MPKTNKYAFVVFVDDDENTEYPFLVRAHLVDWLTARHFSAVISPLHSEDVWTAEDVHSWIESQIRLYGGGYKGQAYFSTVDWNAESYMRPERREWDRNEYQWHTLPPERVRIPKVGDKKKAHYHVYVKLDYSCSAVQMIEKFEQLGVHYFEPVNSERAYIRYMCHLDNPDKARYSVEQVISLGGIDISPLYVQSEADRRELVGAIYKLIKERRPYNVYELSQQCFGDWRMLCEVKGQHAYWSRYLTEMHILDSRPAVEEVHSQDVNE